LQKACVFGYLYNLTSYVIINLVLVPIIILSCTCENYELLKNGLKYHLGRRVHTSHNLDDYSFYRYSEYKQHSLLILVIEAYNKSQSADIRPINNSDERRMYFTAPVYESNLNKSSFQHMQIKAVHYPSFINKSIYDNLKFTNGSKNRDNQASDLVNPHQKLWERITIKSTGKDMQKKLEPSDEYSDIDMFDLSYDTSDELAPKPQNFMQPGRERAKTQTVVKLTPMVKSPQTVNIPPQEGVEENKLKRTSARKQVEELSAEAIEEEKSASNTLLPPAEEQKVPRGINVAMSPHWRRIDVRQKRITRGLSALSKEFIQSWMKAKRIKKDEFFEELETLLRSHFM